MNACHDSVGCQSHLQQNVDVATAVATPTGLITPIVRAADSLGVGDINREVKSLAAQARQGTLQPHQYEGGSFTFVIFILSYFCLYFILFLSLLCLCLCLYFILFLSYIVFVFVFTISYFCLFFRLSIFLPSFIFLSYLSLIYFII